MAKTIFKHNEIIIFLGAGASVEAGIPDSQDMLRQIEKKICSEDENWSRHRDLYRYIRSSVFYADGLEGKWGNDVHFNIERLVNVLDELIKKERHTLYPFVGAWNPKLLEVAGNEGFDQVRELKKKILNVLIKQWLPLQEVEKADYYSGLLQFQGEYQYPLRIFSLNYDLCVEKVCGINRVQRGFIDRTWDWRQFDETSDDPPPLMLYKLHGSVDWFFAEDHRVMFSDSVSLIQDDEIALIFGTSYKLQYVDPFLFLAYELRRWSLDATRAIVCIGYGFNDKHINGILGQSLRSDSKRRLLVVTGPSEDEMEQQSKEESIVNSLNADKTQIEVQACGAKEFLNERLTLAYLSRFFPPEEDLFGEMSDDDL
ncbi:MAG: SIR2 family protein [Bacteroidota bacterium]|nr:SIR2 family protein [Bacteroidota bacterium]